MTPLSKILQDSNYKLTQFNQKLIDEVERRIEEVLDKKGNTGYRYSCLKRQREVDLKPEEVVRQLYLLVLTKEYDYPLERIELEYPVSFGTEKKRSDIVVMDRDRPNVPYIIIELKKPKLKDGKEQLKSYCNATGAPIGVWTNGDQISYYYRKDPNYFEDIPHLPHANQKLSDVLTERWTFEDLLNKDKLFKERKSLKDLILEMEDEVLANAGVDVFEELFKLIFTKLFDEMESVRSPRRFLEFRNYGDTEFELKTKVTALFERARNRWTGVFPESSKIELTPSHLSVCVSSLQDVKLFNSNLDVVDEAFEYLINKTSKGEKGQYFTPRYVIDMCVKMLNPQEHETIIDTAAGSCGFPVHAMFHVWKQILEDEGLPQDHLFTAERKPARCEDYVKEKVFAIDFDEKVVRVGRTLNLIAGDGQSNVLHLNTLDYERWSERTDDDKAWIDTYFEGWRRLKKLRAEKESNQRFNFDVLMANPPFAGDIKESRILSKYDLAKKPNGKLASSVGRDILFIERNLDFLSPGGRMAVVLPQGRFNNSSDKYIRQYFAERCRILAVVGLHGNVFKPHTGTKTSVLFLQKWTDKNGINPKLEDYPIFFATMQEPSKDNSGDKIFLKKRDIWQAPAVESQMIQSVNTTAEPPSRYNTELRFLDELVLDHHGHLIVKHDLFNHDGLTRDGIAEAFIEFAKKERLSFFLDSPFDEAEKKFNSLSEGLEVSSVDFLKTLENKDLRIDSDFFTKSPKVFFKHDYALIGSILKKAQYGISIEMNQEGRGYPIYRMNEIHNMLCDFEVGKYADINLFDFKKFRLDDRDVLFNRTNSFEWVGRTGIYYQLGAQEFTFASYLVRLIPDHSKILPEYLTAFLNSKFGVWDIKRRARHSINQTNVNPEEVKEIMIPLLTLPFQGHIKSLFDNAVLKLRQSQSLHTSAIKLLFQSLGLSDFDFDFDTRDGINSNVKSFSSSFLESGRLDAEYFQRKYDKLLELCSARAVYMKRIKEIQEFNARGLQPEYIKCGEIDVINSRHILETHLDYDNFEKTTLQNWHLQKKAHVLKNDILIYTTGANIGRSQVYLKSDKALASNHVNILRIKNENPLYVAFVLNSKIGRLQTEQMSAGSAQQELYPNHITQFYIPFIHENEQNEISSSVVESLNLQIQSQKLLTLAKQAVETAIEQGETAGETLLESALNQETR